MKWVFILFVFVCCNTTSKPTILKVWTNTRSVQILGNDGHMVIIEKMVDSPFTETTVIGTYNHTRKAKDMTEVLNFLIDSVGLHLITECEKYTQFQ